MFSQRVECRGCSGTGEGFCGRRCGACRGRGERFIAIPHDGSLCPMEGEELPPTADEDVEELARVLARITPPDPQTKALLNQVGREAAAMASRYLETVARHPATVSLALRLPRLAALMAAGLLLAACDVAELDARADAAREAWIAAMEAEGDPPPPPWSSQWDPTVDALCGRRAA